MGNKRKNSNRTFDNILRNMSRNIAKGYYGSQTAPVQILSDISNKIIPETDFSRTLDQISHPGFLRERKREDYKHLLPPAMVTPAVTPAVTPIVTAKKKKRVNLTNPTKSQTSMGAPTRESKKSRPIIGSTANTRGTYTSRKRTGEGDQGTYRNIRPTMGTPGQDMSAIARKPNRVLRMKGGGIAIKGQGKAFLNSKR